MAGCSGTPSNWAPKVTGTLLKITFNFRWLYSAVFTDDCNVYVILAALPGTAKVMGTRKDDRQATLVEWPPFWQNSYTLDRGLSGKVLLD